MSNSIFSLKNKVIVVTGGAGHLGAAFSKAYVEHGATVIIASRNNEKNQQYANELKAQYGIEVFYEQLDLTNLTSIRQCISRIKNKFSKIDVLVNNSYSGKTGTMIDGTDDEWIASYEGSIHGTYRIIKEVLPLMREQKKGSIINVGSMYGIVSPNPDIYDDEGQNSPPHYGSAKAAIIHLTKYLACHFGKDGIRVNAISPGPFPKPIVQNNVEFIQRLSAKNPLGRIGQPEELKGVAVLLASDASSYITGQNISVDGGWTAW